MRNMYRPIKLGRSTLSQEVAEYLQRLMLSGQLRAGDRLPPEQELSESLGVSRTVVREAAKILEAIGAVEVRHGVGVLVVKPGSDALSNHLRLFVGMGENPLQDLQEVRELLEPAIAARAAETATSETITKLEQSVQQLEEELASGGAYLEVDLAFHITLAEATQNSLFPLLLHSIVDAMREIGQPLLSLEGAQRGLAHHHRILEAVKGGEQNKASEAMRQHLEQIKRDLKIGVASRKTKG